VNEPAQVADDVAVRPARTRDLLPGAMLVAVLLSLYGGLALTVDFPRAAVGIHSDEATYYMMAHSLVEDGDLTYRREDLVRVWREFPSGPAGLFLKRGVDILEAGPMRRPPFVWTRTQPDPDRSRLFYGKSFIYPLFAAPLVAAFGTNGFLVFNALLLALAAWCAFLFLRARMRPGVAAMLAGGFVFASVVPVYFVWIAPEIFNFALGLAAYFCWLYKEVAAPASVGRRSRWLFSRWSDFAAAALIGILAFSKVTNLLLVGPIVLWLAWRRQWARAVAAGALCCALAAGLYGANMAISGDWNYQGGDRKTFLFEFPFQTPSSDWDRFPTRHGRDEALTDVIFDPAVFWTNLAHNLKWFFVGRYAGLVAYFFPAVFAMVAYLAAWRRRPRWEHLVFLGALAQMLVFIVATPYTWSGGGSSIGNRYFMSAYGLFVFLLPALTRAWVAVIPWVAGLLFMAPLVLNPFVASYRPGDNANSGPLRLLPVELTMVYDWPINTDTSRVRIWYGDYPKGSGPGFQIYFFDDNTYQQEVDKSFWVKGESRAEFLIKTDRPMKRLVLTLTAGPVPTDVRATLEGRSQEVSLRPGESTQLLFTLGDGFPYQGTWPVWVASVSSSTGFTPILFDFDTASTDTRYLGVRVTPTLVE
jgi:hypothetical protein